MSRLDKHQRRKQRQWEEKVKLTLQSLYASSFKTRLYVAWRIIVGGM